MASHGHDKPERQTAKGKARWRDKPAATKMNTDLKIGHYKGTGTDSSLKGSGNTAGCVYLSSGA
jgi:hypothetical protein